MRVSTAQFHQQNIGNILNRQSNTSKLLEQIATGKRVNTAGDDPVASVAIDNLKQQNKLSDQYLKNIDYAKNHLSQTESQLGDAEDIARTLKDQMLSVLNGRHSDADRQTIAKKMRSDLEALQQVANSRDESGNYFFSGFKTDQKPFEFSGSSPRSISYNGDDGVRNSVVADGVALGTNISGSHAFMDAKNALGDYSAKYSSNQSGKFQISEAKIANSSTHVTANYSINFVDDGKGGVNVEVKNGSNTTLAATPFDPKKPISFNGIEIKLDGTPKAGDSVEISPQSNTNIFDTVEKTIALLEKGDVQSEAGKAELAQQLNNLNQGINQIGLARSEAGVSLQNSDSYLARHQDTKLVNTEALAKLEDLDTAKAITDLNREQLALRAASSTYTKVSNTSLFDFI
ncbi:flagellar hook-associated protein FlgL [Parashewanella curva]|uniref:Flagellar hook-associated protein FlgL n=1 Tax=Parashewanella curva TaxID=2338552 RepID=A0A3L8Q1U7_9GAMM|nr:flagellar hook-associated protein FlgL [Parashewanella curva]RLV61564.1 flagellar hook-associated protein FlgL [Parashewanella curva]